jgi:hypothetical protein
MLRRTAIVKSSPLQALAAALAWLWLGAGCADQANPVVPTTTFPGGYVAGGDRDASPGEVGEADATPAGPDATGVVCNLLTQNCQDLGQATNTACYPEGGVGFCESISGFEPVASWCASNTDCDRGLACRPQSRSSNIYVCQYICDLSETVSTTCADGETCTLMTGFERASSVGYCTAL